MSRPTVSVVIPCFRQGNLLAGAIESVLGQSYPAVEVVVVNDGSPDGTDQVARGYGDRIRYVSQANRGLAAARNAGLAVATGDYVLFLDADDLLASDAIGWLVEAVRGRDDTVGVMGHRRFETDPVVGEDHLPPAGREFGEVFLTWNLGPPHIYLSPRGRVAAVGGFDPTPTGCEDWDLWIRLLAAGCRFAPVPRVGAYYRLSPTSMSRNRLLMSAGRARVLDRVLGLIRRYPAVVAALEVDPGAASREVRRRLLEELDRAGHLGRLGGAYGTAFRCYLRSVGRGRPRAVVSLLALGPRKLRAALRRSTPLAEEACRA